MNTARIETLAHRLFLSLPIVLVVGSATFYPLLTQLQQVALNSVVFLYIAGFVFLKTAAFEQNGLPALKPRLYLDRWIVGFSLSLAALFIGGALHNLLKVEVLLKLLPL